MGSGTRPSSAPLHPPSPPLPTEPQPPPKMSTVTAAPPCHGEGGITLKMRKLNSGKRSSVTSPQPDSDGNRIAIPVPPAGGAHSPGLLSAASPPPGPRTWVSSPRSPLDMRPRWEAIAQGPMSLGNSCVCRCSLSCVCRWQHRGRLQQAYVPPATPVNKVVCLCGSPL